MEAVTAFIEGPGCFLIVWALCARKAWRYIAVVLVSLGQLYGDVLYFGTCLHGGERAWGAGMLPAASDKCAAAFYAKLLVVVRHTPHAAAQACKHIRMHANPTSHEQHARFSLTPQAWTATRALSSSTFGSTLLSSTASGSSSPLPASCGPPSASTPLSLGGDRMEGERRHWYASAALGPPCLGGS